MRASVCVRQRLRSISLHSSDARRPPLFQQVPFHAQRAVLRTEPPPLFALAGGEAIMAPTSV
jgi:hypothetical protein